MPPKLPPPSSKPLTLGPATSRSPIGGTARPPRPPIRTPPSPPPPPIVPSKTGLHPSQKSKAKSTGNKVVPYPPPTQPLDPKSQGQGQGHGQEKERAKGQTHGQGQGQGPRNATLSEGKPPPRPQRINITVPQGKYLIPAEALAAFLPTKMPGDDPRMSVVSDASSPGYHQGSDKPRSYSVRMAPRADHYDKPSDKAWRLKEPPLISPLDSDSKIKIKTEKPKKIKYKKWTVLEPVPIDPQADKIELTDLERCMENRRDFKTCMCCIGQGPRKNNPCACFLVGIIPGAYHANVFSVIVGIISIICEGARISYSEDETEFPANALHIGICVALFVASGFLLYGILKFKLFFCIPWVVCQSILILYYVGVIIYHIVYVAKAGGPYTNVPEAFYHFIAIFLGCFGLAFHAVELWIIGAFMYGCKYDKLGPDTPNPYRMDPDNFLPHPDFHQELV